MIRVDGLTFTYPGADEPAIKNLSIKITPGETIALIGKSGSGKRLWRRQVRATRLHG